MSRVSGPDLPDIPDDFLDAIVTVISERYEPSMDSYRDDPEWQAAYARYMAPGAGNATERKHARLEAAEELFAIEVRHERQS